MKASLAGSISVLALAALGGCASPGTPPTPAASAKLEGTKGNAVSGTVSFRQAGAKLRIEAQLTGLTPGQHGFHIHEKGDCSAPDGSSAGGHFNPLGKMHAHPEAADRHAGDLPQLSADSTGKASLAVEVDVLRLGEGATDVIGRSVVVHAGADDYKSQPAGNSGARIACGVIQRS